MKLSHLLAVSTLAIALAACNSQTSQETVNPANQPVTQAPAAEPPAQEAAAPASEAAVEQPAAQAAVVEPPASQPQPVKLLTLSDEVKKAFPVDKMTTTASGLQYLIEEKGQGDTPASGQVVQVHYEGMLADGTVFDSSFERNEPITFPLGKGAVIPGWDEGISLLPVGSKAKLIIPSDLAYGKMGAGGVIPPNATLYFEVELVDILAGSPESPAKVNEADFTTTDSGLKYADLQKGTGTTPQKGQLIKIHYTGWLEDGTKFDSSLDWGQPYTFPIGEKAVMPGWDEGIATMKVGGKRQLIIPAELAFGEEGAGGVIPPNATLIFEIELVEVAS
jgi:peptidylprolyl isomerase